MPKRKRKSKKNLSVTKIAGEYKLYSPTILVTLK
jgi:hypothetical protein